MSGKLTSIDAAVRHISDGDTVTVSGLGNVLCPEHVLAALEARFLDSGTPSDMTVFTPIRAGNKETGLEHLAHEGLLGRLITGSFNTPTQPNISRLAIEGDVETYAFPMGVSFHLLSQIAAGRPGVLTEVGLGTYVDPRQKGAQYSLGEAEELIELKTLDGKTYLFYRAFPINVAIIRGTTADPAGNVSLEDEPNRLGVLDMAMAAQNSGGTVIAQVGRLTEEGHRDPDDIEVPGVLVDHVVVDKDQTQIIGRESPDFTLTGEIRDPTLDASVDDLPMRKRLVLRRALLELKPGQLVNLGVGMPVHLPRLCLTEGIFGDITFSTEHGIVGGVPSSEEFGTHHNPEGILTSGEVFRLYQGGGLDVSFLGIAQLDAVGNVNNSNFAGMLRGPGGFIDITNRTGKLVFCGSLTAGGLEVAVEDGEVMIMEEGRHQKFVEEVEEVTLNGAETLAKGTTVKVITERSVFELADEEIRLMEVAPGIDIDRDVCDRIGFDISVADDLDTFDPRIVEEGPMNLSL